MALDVLSVPEGTLIVVDEPERHLHRSIIVPLLQAMFDERPHCFFVVATHEIALPTEARGDTLILRKCIFQNNEVRGWDADVLKPDASMPEDLRLAILGSRKRVLFVEGSPEGLDRPLYAVLLPTVTVIAKGQSRSVRNAVTGLRSTVDEHHTEAFGLIDGDDIAKDEIEKLEKNGIYVSPVTSVESLYYCTAGVETVAAVVAADQKVDVKELAASAIDAALKNLALADTQKVLVELRVERRVRNEIFSAIPDRASLIAGPETGTLKYVVPLKEEAEALAKHVAAKELDDIGARFALKRTSVAQSVSTALKLGSSAEYEKIFVRALSENKDLREQMLKRLGKVSELA
jgi:hypothetical protein